MFIWLHLNCHKCYQINSVRFFFIKVVNKFHFSLEFSFSSLFNFKMFFFCCVWREKETPITERQKKKTKVQQNNKKVSNKSKVCSRTLIAVFCLNKNNKVYINLPLYIYFISTFNFSIMFHVIFLHLMVLSLADILSHTHTSLSIKISFNISN